MRVIRAVNSIVDRHDSRLDECIRSEHWPLFGSHSATSSVELHYPNDDDAHAFAAQPREELT